MSTGSGNRARFAREILPFSDVLYDLSGFGRCTSTISSDLFRAYGNAQLKLSRAQAEIASICKTYLRSDPELIRLPVISTDYEGDEVSLRNEMESGLQTFCDELSRVFDDNRIGRVESFANHSCRFNYFDFVNQGGVFTRNIAVVKRTQELVRIRVYALPATHVKDMPRTARRIIDGMDILKPYARVVVGNKVLSESEGTEVLQERTAAGRLVDGATDRARRAGRWVRSESGRNAVRTGATVAAVGAGVAATAWGVAKLAALTAAATATAVADPALILGDKVFYGWE